MRFLLRENQPFVHSIACMQQWNFVHYVANKRRCLWDNHVGIDSGVL